MNWIRVSIAIAGSIMVAVMLLIVLLRREFKTVLERLFIYLLLATFIRELVLLSNVEHQFEYRGMDTVCSILGALNLYTAVLVIIFVASTIIHFLMRAGFVHQRSESFAKKFEFGFIVLTLFVPLIFSIGLWFTGIFGLSTAWCWVREFDNQCDKTDTLGKIFGGYSFLLVIGVLSIILTAAIIIIYCKVARRIKQATDLLKQAVILIVCLVVNVLILIFAAIVVNLRDVELKFIMLYVYTILISIYDLIYPLGFLLSLKYQAISSFLCTKRYQPIHHTVVPNRAVATAPPSNRVTAPSVTVPLTVPYTGEFTSVDPLPDQFTFVDYRPVH